MNKLRIVFMGTPDFAVGILDAIIENNYQVAAVVTTADKPAGRGQKISESAVKKYALDKNLPILQPTNLKSEEFINELKSYKANLFIVVAFRMLPEAVWKLPEFGTFNLHASLLPDYRGAAPINWALINGETTTGVTTFFIDKAIDTGEIILKDSLEIPEDETAGKLHDRLMNLGKQTVIKTLEQIENNKVNLIKQPDKAQKTAYKLNKENCKIDWKNTTTQIYNHIRGLSPYPAAWTFFNDKNNQWNVKIFECTKEIYSHNFKAGKIIIENKKTLKVATTDGFIKILKLQFPTKKPMNTIDFLNGTTLSEESFCS